MGVPKRKTSKARRDKRRTHQKLSTPSFVVDKVTGESRRPHHVDPVTGMYNGRQVIDPDTGKPI